MIKEMLKEYETVTLTNVFKMMTDFVRWGNIRAFYLIEVEGIFDKIFKMMLKNAGNSPGNERGREVFRDLDGDDDDRITLYTEILKSLQIWNVCIAKNLVDHNSEPKVTSIYKQLKN